MRFLKNTRLLFLLFIPIFFVAGGCHGGSENLLVNASAESPNHDSVPAGWENIAGKWHSLEGDSVHHDYGYADSGKYYFFAGYGEYCLLQQDASVQAFAAGIDGGKQKFVVSGKERSLEQGALSDQGMLKWECLDETKSKILFTDSTDTLMSIDKWKLVADTFLAPKFTRFIRVQLVAFRHVGGDNDGYFDTISLAALPSRNFNLILLIALAAVVIVAGGIVYFRKKHKP